MFRYTWIPSAILLFVLESFLPLWAQPSQVHLKIVQDLMALEGNMVKVDRDNTLQGNMVLRTIWSMTAIDRMARYSFGVFAPWGIRDRPTAPRSPWQNGYAERLIGSIRRECIDHVVVLGERHLRHVLLSYLQYYNETRTHLSLDKDAPIPRAVEAIGRILSRPVLGGLHHQYVRI